MPLHLESFISEGKSNNTLSVMLEGVRTADPLYISQDETLFTDTIKNNITKSNNNELEFYEVCNLTSVDEIYEAVKKKLGE